MNPNDLPAQAPFEGERALSEAEKRQRRTRSIALALALGALVILFYAVTIAKLGANALASHI